MDQIGTRIDRFAGFGYYGAGRGGKTPPLLRMESEPHCHS